MVVVERTDCSAPSLVGHRLRNGHCRPQRGDGRRWHDRRPHQPDVVLLDEVERQIAFIADRPLGEVGGALADMEQR
jgi:hypothetical protein